MTPTEINASREVLAENLKRELGSFGRNFPYDRIRTGDWKTVIHSLKNLIVTMPWDTGREFVLLARHVRDCPGEGGLVLPLLQGIYAFGRRSENDMVALKTLAWMVRPLRQQEVDKLVHGLVLNGIDVQGLQGVADLGYAPSLGTERDLLQKYKHDNGWASQYLAAIQKMQPRWHAMRLQAEMREMTPAHTSANEVLHAGRGL